VAVGKQRRTDPGRDRAGTVPFVLLARRIGRLAPGQLVPAYALATATALLLDGLAISFARPLYGSDPTGAAAAILWGAGMGIMLSFVLDLRRAR